MVGYAVVLREVELLWEIEVEWVLRALARDYFAEFGNWFGFWRFGVHRERYKIYILAIDWLYL